MSQAKVDARKNEKANRKETMKKEKIKKRITAVISGCVAILVVAWIGVSINNSITAKQDKEVVQMNVDALSDYLNTIE